MARRSGSVRNAPRNMQFNRIGKLIRKFVEPGSTDATAEPFSRGNQLPRLVSCHFIVSGLR